MDETPSPLSDAIWSKEGLTATYHSVRYIWLTHKVERLERRRLKHKQWVKNEMVVQRFRKLLDEE